MLIRSLQVQSGGSFDVDYSVVGPGDKLILDGSKERQGDFVFTATNEGEYRFCFDNDMSTVTDKMVDFEVTVGTPTTVLETKKTLIDLCNPGRERSPRYTSIQTRRSRGADFTAYGIYLQAVWSAQHYHTQPKIFSYPRESQLQYSPEVKSKIIHPLSYHERVLKCEAAPKVECSNFPSWKAWQFVPCRVYKYALKKAQWRNIGGLY